MRVLIADDDAVSRRLLQSYLQKWGCEVSSAENGAEAWSLFRQGEFPLVITDWMMPELDGLELLRRIRSGPSSGYVYVILLTAKTQQEDLVEGMEAGADDFLTKPFDRDELRVRLRAGQRIVQLEREVRAAKATLAPTGKAATLERVAVATAREIERSIAEALDDLTVLRRDLVDALDRTPNADRFARWLDRSLGSLQRAAVSARSLADAAREGELESW